MAYNEEVTMMMSVVPGSLTGISALMGGLSSITNVFTDITRQVDATFGLIDTSIITASTIVAQFGLSAAEAAGQFEQGLKVAQMVSGQTAQEMDYLRQKANEFSVSYRVDIDQITEGLQTLGRAGLNSASEQTEVLQNGLSTAKLEGRDLNSVLEELIQNTALLGGDLKSSDFGEASQYLNDVMVATSMTAPITTHDVSETLKYSGGIAAAAGANVNTEEGRAILEDYMGAIAAFAQKGVTGSIAGTALRAFFNKPATQDSSVTDALASIHLKPEYLWEDDENTMKPVSEQIRIIKNQMDELNVSTMDQLQIWSKIVGGKMGQQMMKLDSDDIKELTKDIQSSNDAQSLASGTFDTYQMKMKEMTEQGQVAFRQFGEYAAVALTPLLEILKRIFEFFSNPIVSLGAFLSALALVMSAISKIKNVFNSLKQELATVMHYVKTGEPLMAYRPSTARKANRFQGKDRFSTEQLATKYPGQSELIAYGREKGASYDESLINKFGKDNALIYKDANKLRRNQFAKAGFGNITNIKSMPGFILAENKRDLDRFITQFLIEENLWTKEFTETYNRFNGDLDKTIKYHIDDIENILIRRYKNDGKIKIKRIKKPNPNKYQNPNEGRQKQIDREAANEAYKEREKDYYDLIGSSPNQSERIIAEEKESIKKFKDYDVDKRVAFDYQELKKQQDGIDEFFMGQDKQFRETQKTLLKENAINAFIDSFEKGGSNNLQSASISTLITNKTDSRMLGRFLKHHGLLSGRTDLDSEIIRAFEKRAREQRIEHADNFVKDFVLDNKKNKMGYNTLAYGLMSRDDFIKNVGRYPSDVSTKDLQLAFLRAAGIQDAHGVIKNLPLMNEFEDFTPLSPEEISSLFGLSGAGANKVYNSYERANIKGFNPHKAGTKAEEDKKEAEERTKLEKKIRFDIINNAVDNFPQKYDSLEVMQLSSKDLTKIGAKFLSLKQIRRTISDVYNINPKELIQGTNRKTIIPEVYPFFSDWMKLSENEMKSFVNTLNQHGYNIDYRKNRTQMVGNLNKALAKEATEEKMGVYDYKDKVLNFLGNIEQVLRKGVGEIQQNNLEKRQNQWSSLVPSDPDYLKREVVDIDDYKKRAQEEFEKKQGYRYLSSGKIPFTYLGRDITPENSNDLLQQRIKEKIESEKEKDRQKIAEKVEKDMEEKRNLILVPSRIKDEKMGKNSGWSSVVPSDPDYLEREVVDIEDYKKRAKEEFEKTQSHKSTGFTQIKSKFSGFELSISDTISTGWNSFKKALDADRSDKILNFGKGSKTNKFLNAIDMLGGPFMVATAGATLVIEGVKAAFESYCKTLQEAEDQLKEAYSNLESAESSLRQTYKNNNPDATDDEVDQMIYDTYATMAEDMNKAVQDNDKAYFEKLNLDASKENALEYDTEKDDGSLKEVEEAEKTDQEAYEEAIKENTGALYEATSQLNVAISKLSTEMLGAHWGMDSGETWFSDMLGGFFDKAFNSNDMFYGYINGVESFNKGYQAGSTFSSNNAEFLMTDSQKDENYPGYTEMAGLMLEDIKDMNGNWIAGMRTMMGRDVELLNSMIPNSGREWMKTLSMKERGGIGAMDARTNAKLQASMKQDPKTWKKLAREYAKQDMNKKQGKSVDKNVKRIKGLTEKLSKQVGTGFNQNHIMQAAYLVQMQEMYKVAQDTMVPIIGENLQLAGKQLITQSGIQSTTGNTASNSGGTWGTATVISGLVAIIAKTKAAEYAHQTAQEADPGHYENGKLVGGTDLNNDKVFDEKDREIIKLAQNTSDYKKFQQEANQKYYQGRDKNSAIPNSGDNLMAPALFIAQMYGAGAKMTGYDYDAKSANDNIAEWIQGLTGKEDLADIYTTLGKNYTENDNFKQRLVDNYLNATEENDGTGSNTGSGSGSGDNDNKGTKKERVDLVLCSKKEIPKLNVNLFKKPPTFTVLNKNFKVRDVKINTEDTPKAIMSSIKNAFIDVQKRSDPKIIQDEDAVYDPEGATDGNPLPSGTAKTRTSE